MALWLCWLSLGHWGPAGDPCVAAWQSWHCSLYHVPVVTIVPGKMHTQLLLISTRGCHTPGCDVPVWCLLCWRTAPHCGLGTPGPRDMEQGLHCTRVGCSWWGNSLVDRAGAWWSCGHPALSCWVQGLCSLVSPGVLPGCSNPVSHGADVLHGSSLPSWRGHSWVWPLCFTVFTLALVPAMVGQELVICLWHVSGAASSQHTGRPGSWGFCCHQFTPPCASVPAVLGTLL